MKLLKEQCMEYSIFSMFFMIVSIKTFFLNKFLSAGTHHGISHVAFNFSVQCIPLRKRFSNKDCLIYPLSAHSFLLMFYKNRSCFKGLRLSTFPVVNMKLMNFILLLIIRCNLKLKSYPMKHYPLSEDLLISYESGFCCFDRHVKEWRQ